MPLTVKIPLVSYVIVITVLSTFDGYLKKVEFFYIFVKKTPKSTKLLKN